jgi:hypothetical protein
MSERPDAQDEAGVTEVVTRARDDRCPSHHFSALTRRGEWTYTKGVATIARG